MTKSLNRRRWAVEQLTYLREAYTSGVATSEIHQRLNEMPGAKVAYIRIAQMASKMAIHRPADFVRMPIPREERRIRSSQIRSVFAVVPAVVRAAPVVVRPSMPVVTVRQAPFSMLGGTLGLRR